jgi:arylsulfatase A-like enzyme
MVSFPDPHGPNTVRAPYDTMFAQVDVPLPANLSKTDAQTPKWAPTDKKVNERALRRIMPAYYGMIKCIDDNVGRMLNTLREKKLLDETIVVFTADHGDLCGEHGRLNKGVPYEGSAKIPMVLYYPKHVPPGTEIHQALSCVDFAPTILEIMSVEHQQKFEGRDASALFAGTIPSDWNDIAVLRGTRDWLCAVTGQYKLVYSRKDRPWLFDLMQDPHELTNVYDKRENREVARRLARHLWDYASRYNDPYVENPEIRTALQAAMQ